MVSIYRWMYTGSYLMKVSSHNRVQDALTVGFVHYQECLYLKLGESDLGP